MSTRFAITLDITLRPARAEDLPRLAWSDPLPDSLPECDDSLLLLAECGGEAVAQVWVDFTRKAAAGVGLLRMLRVHPVFRSLGIGTRLLAAAEAAIRERGLHTAELGVAQDDPRARQSYERLGYAVVAEGPPQRGTVNAWVMRKPLD